MLGSAVDLDDNGAHVRVAQRLWKNPDRSRCAEEIRSDSVARTSRARSRGVPEITQIIDTTDHAAGKNPYYQPSKK
jgi:hypothetical protein